ncbi:Hypothetical protein KLENKIAIHU_3530, partial [Klenkia terrae]
VLLVPAAVYGWAVVLPWVRGEGLLQTEGRVLDLVSPALALLGALVALVLSGTALLSAARLGGGSVGRGTVVVHVVVAAVALGLLAWFLSPAGAALHAAQFD